METAFPVKGNFTVFDSSRYMEKSGKYYFLLC